MQGMHAYPFKRISLIFAVAMTCLATTLTAISWSIHSHTALAATSGPALTVNASAGRHAISRDIYGMATPDSTLQQQIKLPEQRWGGDAATNYNWLQDSTNAGSDWYYVGGTGTSPTPTAGAQVDSVINAQQSVGGDSLVTIPIIGYVDNSSSWNCSYPSSLYPTQQSYDPYIKLADGDQCGNGQDTSGNLLTDNNISLDYNQVNPSWMQAWIQHIVQTHGNSAASNVVYQLDNEPENWNIVHYDVHPNPVGYDELVNDSINYAKMIKDTDSTAQTMGPSNGYSYAYVHLKDAPGDDMASHNGMAWIPYYLQQMNNYQQTNGTRLLDYLDVHYYGDASSDADDATTDAARLNSTRALWDPTYSGSNSVGQYLSPTQQIGQIPALQNWVQQYYPGTKTSISEYYFGDAKNLNGALTEADVLGIFGSQGLDSANMWYSPAATDPAAYAFRMYLNYDGNGSKFGDTSVQASSADQGQLSVYAAQRSSDNALTLTMVNKTGNDLTSNVALNNFSAAANAQVYTYSGANLSSIVQQPNVSVSNGSFTNTFPANSITLVVIPPSGSTGTTPTPTTPTPTPVITPTSTPTSGTTTLNPTDDRDNWAAASGTANTINISQWQIGYFKFNLSSLSSSISSAHFKLYRPDLTQGNITLTAYQVNSNSWSEGSNNLPSVGSAITTASSNTVGYVDFDLTSYIQAALAGGSGQVTIAIGGSNGAWQDFYSKDNGSDEPELIVTSGTTTLNPTDDRDNWAAASGTANTINISQWQIGYFKFNLSSLSSSISSAHFKLYRPDLTQGNITLTAYQVNSNSWSEGSNNLPSIGSAITTASSTTVGYVDFDLTSYIQAALAGGSGQVTIAIGGSNGAWQDFYSKDNGTDEPELIVQ